MTAPIVLHSWRVHTFTSQRSGRRRALVEGVRPDGETIRSSVFIAVDGDVVTTHSGGRYRLVPAPRKPLVEEYVFDLWVAP